MNLIFALKIIAFILAVLVLLYYVAKTNVDVKDKNKD